MKAFKAETFHNSSDATSNVPQMLYLVVERWFTATNMIVRFIRLVVV